ncbi:MAG: hypothetical protein PSV24_00670 [Rhodoferax sp.]|nr:hypothetical protein [Rhodoferax sp.]
MKALFSLVNFVIGLLMLLVGLGNFWFIAHDPTAVVTGAVTVVVGATFIWMASWAMFNSAQH